MSTAGYVLSSVRALLAGLIKLMIMLDLSTYNCVSSTNQVTKLYTLIPLISQNTQEKFGEPRDKAII